MPYPVLGSFHEGAGLQPYDDAVVQATKSNNDRPGRASDPTRTSLLGEAAEGGRAVVLSCQATWSPPPVGSPVRMRLCSSRSSMVVDAPDLLGVGMSMYPWLSPRTGQ